MSSISILYHSVPLTIIFEYQPAEGDNFHSPRISPWAEIELVTIEDSEIDISPLLTDKQMDEIEAQVLQEFNPRNRDN